MHLCLQQLARLQPGVVVQSRPGARLRGEVLERRRAQPVLELREPGSSVRGSRSGPDQGGEDLAEGGVDGDGRVDLVITSFSAPADWRLRLAGPAGPAFQRAWAGWLGRRLRRITR